MSPLSLGVYRPVPELTRPHVHEAADREFLYQAQTSTEAAAACAKDAEHGGLIALTDVLKSLDLQAGAAAALGRSEPARPDNMQTDEWRERVIPDDLDALGGLFTCPVEKQRHYSVECEALLGNGSAETLALAERAVEGFSDPTAASWAFGDLAGAQCDLALVRLFSGDLDGAAAMRPVLDLPVSHQNTGIVVSAQRARAGLTNGSVNGAVVARDLTAEIEAFPATRPALPRE